MYLNVFMFQQYTIKQLLLALLYGSMFKEESTFNNVVLWTSCVGNGSSLYIY